MIEPIDTPAGPLVPAYFAYQSSSSLLHAIECDSSIECGLDEAKKLTEVLLHVQTRHDNEADFLAIKHLLLRCGELCEVFKGLITHSNTTAKDSNQMQYTEIMSVAELPVALASYKSTIYMIVCETNIARVRVLCTVLDDYKGMINNKISNLKNFQQKLRDRQLFLSATDMARKRWIEEEIQCINEYLSICTRAKNNAVDIQPVSSKLLLNSTLRLIRTKVDQTVSVLEACRLEAERALLLRDLQPDEVAAAQQQARDSEQTIGRYSDVIRRVSYYCNTIRFEDILADGGSNQVVVSTLGGLIDAVKLLRQMSDTLQ